MKKTRQKNGFKMMQFILVMGILGWGVLACFHLTVSAEDKIPPPNSDALMEVKKAYFEEGNHTEIVTLVISLQRPVEPKIFSLENPPRLVIDIPNAYANEVLPNQISPNNTALVQAVRIGENKEEKLVRFVWDLHADKKYDVTPRLYIPKGDNPSAKLVVTVTPAKENK